MSDSQVQAQAQAQAQAQKIAILRIWRMKEAGIIIIDYK